MVLPTYPFQRREYRLGGEPAARSVTAAPDPSAHPLLGRRVRSPLVKETLFEVTLGTDALPFLADHKVHGHVIVPGAALLEMASAAAAEVLGPNVLEDVVFQEALVLPPNGGRTVQLVVSPGENESSTLRLISMDPTSNGEGDWRLHVSSVARKVRPTGGGAPVSLASLRARCGESVDVVQYYQWLRKIGIDLGPAFQGLEQLWRRDGEALALVRLHAATLTSAQYDVDPTLLDAGLSIVGAALPRGARGEAYIPFALETFRQHGRAGTRFWSHARLRDPEGAGRTTLTADIALFDDDGRVVVEVNGLRLKRADRATLAHSTEEFAQWLYAVEWRPPPRAAGWRERVPAGLASPAAIAARVEPVVGALVAQHDISVYDQLLPALDVLCSAYVVKALRLLGWTPRLGDRVTVRNLADRLRIKDQHRRLLGRFLEMLGEDGLLRPLAPEGGAAQADAEWEVLSLPAAVDPDTLGRDLAMRFPDASAEREITVRCGDQLAAALRGECDPLGLLFPGGSFEAAEKLYQRSAPAQVLQSLVREAIAAAIRSLPEDRPLRILEVGAGTGGTTTYVLPVLPAGRTEYVFTDISTLFVTRAREKFAPYPFLSFEVLDIEQDPVRQGFSAHGYDIVVAANVLHATRDLRQTLGHVRQLLAPEGLLVLVEVAAPQRWADLTFGLLDGWWRFADTDLRPSYPLLSDPQWFALLEEAGFGATVKIPGETVGSRILAEHAILLVQGPQEVALPAHWPLAGPRGPRRRRRTAGCLNRGTWRLVCGSLQPRRRRSRPSAASFAMSRGRARLCVGWSTCGRSTSHRPRTLPRRPFRRRPAKLSARPWSW